MVSPRHSEPSAASQSLSAASSWNAQPHLEITMANRPTPAPRQARTGTRLLLAGAAVAAVAIVAFGSWYLFLRPSGPAAIGSAPPVVPSDAPVAVLTSTDGTWTVDPAIGSFDDFSGS
jgi:hypothetical protein